MTKDNTFYFSHDYNTRSDNKVKKLILKHGMAGYGVFWAIIEDLYNNANALPTDYELIAFDLRVDESLVKSVINDFGLFVIENDTFGSASVERRLNERNLKSENARKSALNRWNKSERIANALRTQSECNAIKENKEKENKEKENKGDDDESQTPPSSPNIDLSNELFQNLNEDFAEYVQNCINSRAPIFLKKEIANKKNTYFQLVKNILALKKSMNYLRSKETNETLEDCEKRIDKSLVDWLKEQTEGKIEHSWDGIPDIAQHALNYIRKQEKLTKNERTKSHLGTSTNKHTGAIETKSNDYSRTGW